MAFLSPIWLFCLLPWAVLVVMLLWRTPKQIQVPFVELWQGTGAPQPIRSHRLPPTYVIAALLAVLLAILAAAGPVFQSQGMYMTVIVDRGITMSANSERMQESIAQAAKAGTWESVDLIPIPGEPIEARGDDWENTARGLRRTALDTRDPLIAAIQSRLTPGAGPIIVLSDQTLPIDHPILVQIAPSELLENVSIVQAMARLLPVPGILVRLRNQSDQQHALIRIDGVAHPVDLPARDREKTYHFDSPHPDQVIHVQVEVSDDLAIDNEAWLVRNRNWPAIETRSPLPTELVRMIDVYEKARPSDNERRIVLSASEQELGNDPGVIVGAGSSENPGEWSVVTHPITKNVSIFSSAPGSLVEGRGEGSSPPPVDATWMPIVTAGGKPIISIRETPARQVRVHLNSPEFVRTPDFVILWTNIFDWIGQGDAAYTALPVQLLASEWKPLETPAGDFWPGVYQRPDGALLAMNALDVRLNPSDDVVKAANRQLHLKRTGMRPASKMLLLGSVLGVLFAAISWPRTYSANSPARV